MLPRRHWMGVIAAVVIAAVAVGTGPAVGQPVELTVTGQVANPRTLTLADLQAMPAVTGSVTWAGPQGPQTETFTGAALWPVITAAAPVDADGPRTRLQHAVLARGRDGYAVLIAIGELNPDFEGKPVLIAYAQDGKLLPVLRLVVPGDHHAGRAVRDLVAIEVR